MEIIELEQLTAGKVRNLAGRERGAAARAEFGLDALDQAPEKVLVRVPEDLYGISSSFFSGMFSRSLEVLGDEKSFLKKYDFDADATIMAQIRHAIDRCLMIRG